MSEIVRCPSTLFCSPPPTWRPRILVPCTNSSSVSKASTIDVDPTRSTIVLSTSRLLHRFARLMAGRHERLAYSGRLPSPDVQLIASWV